MQERTSIARAKGKAPASPEKLASALLVDRPQPGVVVLTLNRPESRNPLGGRGVGDKLAAACQAINADRDVRCAILTGAGPAFSAGGNVKAMRERSGAFAGAGVHIRERYRNGIHRIVKSLWGLEVPLIAAVNGPAIGLGNDVACLADMRIAADTAIFGATFLKIGLVPGDGGSWSTCSTRSAARCCPRRTPGTCRSRLRRSRSPACRITRTSGSPPANPEP